MGNGDSVFPAAFYIRITMYQKPVTSFAHMCKYRKRILKKMSLTIYKKRQFL